MAIASRARTFKHRTELESLTSKGVVRIHPVPCRAGPPRRSDLAVVRLLQRRRLLFSGGRASAEPQAAPLDPECRPGSQKLHGGPRGIRSHEKSDQLPPPRPGASNPAAPPSGPGPPTRSRFRGARRDLGPDRQHRPQYFRQIEHPGVVRRPVSPSRTSRSCSQEKRPRTAPRVGSEHTPAACAQAHWPNARRKRRRRSSSPRSRAPVSMPGAAARPVVP